MRERERYDDEDDDDDDDEYEEATTGRWSFVDVI